MKGITIYQPWIDLILRGAKKMELRILNQTSARSYRGRIALHASQKIDFGAAYFYKYAHPWELKRGHVLGMADVIDVILIDKKNYLDHLDAHLQYLPVHGPVYGICLDNIRILPKPIKMRGQPSIFDLDPEIIAQLI